MAAKGQIKYSTIAHIKSLQFRKYSHRSHVYREVHTTPCYCTLFDCFPLSLSRSHQIMA